MKNVADLQSSGSVDVIDAGTTTGKTINRVKVKVKRSKDSFRPGAKVTAQAHKALHFLIPTKGGASVDAEAVTVKALAKDLANAADLTVDSIVIRDYELEIVLDLPTVGDISDDQLLSDTFTLLNDTIVASAVLQNGLHPTERPSWTYTINDFVSDDGVL
jgi:hypothetical protein